MCPFSSAQVSKLLDDWGQGNQDAREALIPLVYDELRRFARRQLRANAPTTPCRAPHWFTRHTFRWPTRNLRRGRTVRTFLVLRHK